MLKSLIINNVVLIKKAEINFANGLCVLSGETGSGKSILLDALGLAIGFRSNFRLIGADKNFAQVVAEFDISANDNCRAFLQQNDLLLDGENNIIIRRILKEGTSSNSSSSSSSSSSSKAYINDNPVGMTLLAKLGEFLVEIHGQNDQRGLLNSSCHLHILDNFAKNGHKLQQIGKIYANFKEIDDRINEIKQKQDFLQREQEYLEHVILELTKANSLVGEEDELKNKKDHLVGREKILKFLKELKSNLLEASSQLISGQRYFLRNQNIIDQYLVDNKDDMESLNEVIDAQISQLDEKISNLDAKIFQISNSHDNLDEIEERLFLIRSLARKHNVSCDELPALTEQLQVKLDKISHDQSSIANLEQEREKLWNDYNICAIELNNSRQEAAKILSGKVEAELQFLKMASVKFAVNISYEEQKISDLSNQEFKIRPSGLDRVEFKASINNRDFDNIAKIASGGELSRFMLALKVAISADDFSQTMIFDEIDTGIGGSVANAVGMRLKKLSQNRQILVVTHQPQIAAKSDMHLQISKVTNDAIVNTVITRLDDQQKQREIARMLSGEDISQEALDAAKSLINSDAFY